MKLLRSHIVCLCATLVFQTAAFAQEETDAEDGLTDDVYETVVVGARRKTSLFEQSRSVSVASDDDILERPARTVGETLDEEVGVQLQQTNRGAGAPFIRGQVGPSNLIVFDGIRFNNGTFRTGPNQYLNLFDPFSLGQIEVLRGSSGVLYGADTIGGVIHLAPRPLTYARGIGSLGATRFQSADNAFTLAPEASWSNNTFSAVAGGALNWYGDLETGGGAVVPASSYREFSGRFRLGALISPETELQANYFGTWVLDSGRVDRLYADTFREYDDANHIAYLRLNHLGEGAWREVDATLSVNVLNEAVARNDCVIGDVYDLVDQTGEPIETSIDPGGCTEGRYDAIVGKRENHDDSITVGGALTTVSDLQVAGLSLHWGLDAYYSFVDSSLLDYAKPDVPAPDDPDDQLEPWLPAEAGRGNFSDDSTYGNFGAFLQAVHEVPVGEHWRLCPEAGVRLGHVRALAPMVPEVGDVSYHHTGVAGGARFLALLRAQLALYAGWSQGYRPPNLQETTQLGDTGTFFEIPNPDLQPERSNELEVGVRLQTDVIAFEVVGYYLAISDIITRRPASWGGESEIDGAPVVQRTNADSGRFFGVETALEVWILERLSLRGNLTWTEGEIESGDEAYVPRRLPPIGWLAALRYTHPGAVLYVEALAKGAGAQRELSPGDEADLRICGSEEYPGVLVSDLGEECLGTDAWVDLGFRVGANYRDALDVTLTFSNVLDAVYRTHGSGFDAPGFSAMLAIAWNL